MKDLAKTTLAMLLAAGMLSGCGAILAGTAGGVAGSEIEEDDGNFDPLENTAVGEPIDDATDAVGEAADDAGDAIGETYEDVTE